MAVAATATTSAAADGGIFAYPTTAAVLGFAAGVSPFNAPVVAISG